MGRLRTPEIITYSESKNNYNCFASIEQADEYHSKRGGNPEWDESDDDTIRSVLFNATAILNRQKWLGRVTNYEQNLVMPRRFLETRNNTGKVDRVLQEERLLFSEYFDEDSIPQPVIDATAELANYLLLRNDSGINEISQYTDQVSGIKLGKTSLAIRENNDYFTDMPNQVYYIIREFLVEVHEIDMGIKQGIGSLELIR